MPSNKIGVTINRIQLDNVAIRDLEELETVTIAKQVEDRLREIEAETGMVDTLKLSLLTAMSFAAELYVRQQELESAKQLGVKSLDEMIAKLEGALSARTSPANDKSKS